MTVSVFDSGLYGGLYGDDEVTRLFSDSADLRAMLLFEGALARVQGQLGIIPPEAGKAIHRASLEVMLDPASLRDGTARAGVPVPALVEAFRNALPDQGNAAYVHWGATSQDVMDTGLILRLRRVLEIYEERLTRLIALLADLAEHHRDTVMAGRTRHQNATPTTLGAKIAAWGMPLLRHQDRLAELRPRLLQVSLGGASGTLAAMDGRGRDVTLALAQALDLGAPRVPWHSTRDSLTELAGLATLISGSLGKMGQDLLLLMQSDVAEVRAGAAGGSSTMPHKRNPVGAEVLVQLAISNAHAIGAVHQAMLHSHERDAVAWGQEWLRLPEILCGTGVSLLVAADLAATLSVDSEAMVRPFAAHQGIMFAEACSFALAEHMPRPEAQALVKSACDTALEEGRPLRGVLAGQTDAPVPWEKVFDPLVQAGEAPAIADSFVAAARDTD